MECKLGSSGSLLANSTHPLQVKMTNSSRYGQAKEEMRRVNSIYLSHHPSGSTKEYKNHEKCQED